MSIPKNDSGDYSDAILAAHSLVDLGVPIFSARMTKEGDPDRTDVRWSSWHRTTPSHRAVEGWKPGTALCAVTGTAFDVLDYDPRNGGELSIARLSKDLDEDGPEVFWRIGTPSAGQHLYISPLGIGSHNGFMAGLDLKGGRPDGNGRGFVFLPPTVRPSKATGKPTGYRILEPLRAPDGRACAPLIAYIEREIATRAEAEGAAAARRPLAELKAACMAADAGGQRTALLRLVHEWERKGYDQDDILELLMPIVEAMPAYDEKDPWFPARSGRPDRHLRGLLHRQGEIAPDGTPEELAGIGEAIREEKLPTGLVQSVSKIEHDVIKWLWKKYLALGELTILDGEKGQGKTFVVYSLAALASRGMAFPGTDAPLLSPVNVIIFTHEGVRAIRPRLLAAGADLERVFIHKIKTKTITRKVRGKVKTERVTIDPLALPGGAELIGQMVTECDASLCIWDPITDFLAEDIQTHNDASVRRALNPLGIVLSQLGAAGLAIRHMNKDRGADAKFRGTGTTAFQNRGRVHLVCGEIDPAGVCEAERAFGIGMADANDTARVEGALAYHIVDSNVPLDDDGAMVGRVEWDGYVDVSLNELTRGISTNEQGRGGGRKPLAQELVEEVLIELFPPGIEGNRSAATVIEALKANGCSTAPSVLSKARHSLGITTRQERKRGGFGVQGWVWSREL